MVTNCDICGVTPLMGVFAEYDLNLRSFDLQTVLRVLRDIIFLAKFSFFLIFKIYFIHFRCKWFCHVPNTMKL